MHTRDRILHMAQEAGFDLVGLAPLAPPQDGLKFQEWLEDGCHGTMDYLEHNRERILAPQDLLLPTQSEGRQTLLMVGLGHSRLQGHLEDGARVARYALGRDYHNWMGKALKRLGKRLRAEGLVNQARPRVDAVPLMERSHAAEAGLGVRSKAANLLHPRFGPWFFLGELILDVDLEPTQVSPNLSCGTCTACLDACPTGALTEPGRLDARLCISYQTIENRGTIPTEMREAHGDWLFGCDICSEVCPWGHKAPNLAERFGTHKSMETISMVSLLDPALSQAAFSQTFEGSAVSRPKRPGLARNAALVLGNRPSDEGRIALLQALEDPSPIVRETSAWALAKAHAEDANTQAHLEKAARNESDPEAKALMRASRERWS